MKRYRILKQIMLSFIDEKGQFHDDYFFLPGCKTILEANKHTIWAVYKGKRKESITVVHVIQQYLKDGRIEEIK